MNIAERIRIWSMAAAMLALPALASVPSRTTPEKKLPEPRFSPNPLDKEIYTEAAQIRASYRLNHEWEMHLREDVEILVKAENAGSQASPSIYTNCISGRSYPYIVYLPGTETNQGTWDMFIMHANRATGEVERHYMGLYEGERTPFRDGSIEAECSFDSQMSQASINLAHDMARGRAVAIRAGFDGPN